MTVYVVVEVGLAVTLEPVEELNVEDGLHVYVLAPKALSRVDCPLQILSLKETERTGTGFTVTVTCVVEVHPSEFPSTVYVVVTCGVAVTFAPVDELSVEEGLHKYVFAPVALSTVDCPKQMVLFGETESAGSGFTVTVTCAVAVHPSKSPVTV